MLSPPSILLKQCASILYSHKHLFLKCDPIALIKMKVRRNSIVNLTTTGPDADAIIASKGLDVMVVFVFL